MPFNYYSYKYNITESAANSDSLSTQWLNENWSDFRENLKKLQQRIFKLKRIGNDISVNELRKLQAEIIVKQEFKMLAVKNVTSNKGAKTAGVDKMSRLSAQQKYELVNKLCIDGKARDIRRIYIPKPNSPGESRPLGIPTIMDRCKQELVRMALEPEWEAVFEPRTYGFRTGRSTWDAVKYLKDCLQKQPKHIIDCDIKKCFDTINHDYLIEKIGIDSIPIIKTQCLAWLKAGIIEKDITDLTKRTVPKTGTPQGGIISPLFCLIALHGMQSHIVNQVYLKHPGNRTKMAEQTKVIQFADDTIILLPSLEARDIALNALKEFLLPIGLQLNMEKTRLLHSVNIEECDNRDNKFNFLGFTFTVFKKNPRHGNNPSPYKVKILPSKKNIDRFKTNVKQSIKKSKTSVIILRKVNPLFRGWANYFGFSDAQTYRLPAALDKFIFTQLIIWQNRKYKTKRKIKQLWMNYKGNKWTFYAKIRNRKKEIIVIPLVKLPNFPYSSVNYVMVADDASIYDEDLAGYWIRRQGRYFGKSNNRWRLYARQKGICPVCGHTLNPCIQINEIHHVTPKSEGGIDLLSNLQLLHKECHAQLGLK